MKEANKALVKQFKTMNVDKVEAEMDDMEELMMQAEEIQSAMGRSYNTDDIDEADLEAELAAMEGDPSLFFSSEEADAGTADYLDLPATSTAEVGGVAEEAKPAAEPAAS